MSESVPQKWVECLFHSGLRQFRPANTISEITVFCGVTYARFIDGKGRYIESRLYSDEEVSSILQESDRAVRGE